MSCLLAGGPHGALHHKGGTPKTFATSICKADVGEVSTTVLSLIYRNTDGAAWLLLVFMETYCQPAPLPPLVCGLNIPTRILWSMMWIGHWWLWLSGWVRLLQFWVKKTQGQRPKKYKCINFEGKAGVGMPGCDVEHGECQHARVSIEARSLSKAEAGLKLSSRKQDCWERSLVRRISWEWVLSCQKIGPGIKARNCRITQSFGKVVKLLENLL